MPEYEYQLKSDATSDDSDSPDIPKKSYDESSDRPKNVRGYWLLTNNGRVLTAGAAPHFGGENPDSILAVALVSANNGIIRVFEDGTVLSDGEAPGFTIEQPTSSKIASASLNGRGDGLWVALENGGVKALGTAVFHGSGLDNALQSSIVAIAAGKDGYWLLTKNGQVVVCGETNFYGSATEQCAELNTSAVSIKPHPNHDGYWIALENGQVIAHGRSTFHGRREEGTANIVDIAISPDAEGYWLVDETGYVSPHGFVTDIPPKADSDLNNEKVIAMALYLV